jgi:hypothetical protein
MIKKFEETGLIMDDKLPVCHRTGQSLNNIAAVSESVAESPGALIHHCSQQLNILGSTMQRILAKDLHLHAYKIQTDSSQRTMCSAENLLIGCWKTKKWVAVF